MKTMKTMKAMKAMKTMKSTKAMKTMKNTEAMEDVKAMEAMMETTETVKPMKVMKAVKVHEGNEAADLHPTTNAYFTFCDIVSLLANLEFDAVAEWHKARVLDDGTSPWIISSYCAGWRDDDLIFWYVPGKPCRTKIIEAIGDKHRVFANPDEVKEKLISIGCAWMCEIA